MLSELICDGVTGQSTGDLWATSLEEVIVMVHDYDDLKMLLFVLSRPIVTLPRRYVRAGTLLGCVES